MNKEQLRRKKAVAAARREAWTVWALVALAVGTAVAWGAMFMA